MMQGGGIGWPFARAPSAGSVSVARASEYSEEAAIQYAASPRGVACNAPWGAAPPTKKRGQLKLEQSAGGCEAKCAGSHTAHSNQQEHCKRGP